MNLNPLRHTNVRWALLAAVLATLTGCGGMAVGHWKAVRAVPNRQVFCIDAASFNRDGTYEADVTIDGRTRRESGEYDFTGWRLSLRPHDGGQRHYPANVKGASMEVRSGEARVRLRKVDP